MCFQILYTQPNPSIKYEYFTEALDDDIDVDAPKDAPDLPPTVSSKHTRHPHQDPGINRYPHQDLGIARHPDLVGLEAKDAEKTVNENVVGERKFMWKIMSYTQCTRSCGGGIQVCLYTFIFYDYFGLVVSTCVLRVSGLEFYSRPKYINVLVWDVFMHVYRGDPDTVENSSVELWV